LSEGKQIAIDGATGEVFLGGFTPSTPAESTVGLSAVMEAARNAAQCAVLARVTLPADVAEAQRMGVSGLVTAVDDVLAAAGRLDELVRVLVESSDPDRMNRVADIVADEFAPLLDAAGETEIGVRAVDFRTDEIYQVVQRSPAASEHPELWVPVGVPSLITAQLDGLARAARKAGNRARLHLAVRHITDPAQARAPAQAPPPAEARALAQPPPTDGDEYRLTVGSYLTNPRGAHYAAEIAAHSAALWLDVRALQAALFGVPASHLTTVDPIDEYVRRGLLSTDPRTAVDASVEPLLERVAALRDTLPRCPVGIRLAGEVYEELVERLYQLGFRRYAVDVHEVRPMVLALGKAATGR